jgi:hypothetical protein
VAILQANKAAAPDLYHPILQLPRTFYKDVRWIGEILAASSLHDPLTEGIRIWHKEFTDAIQLKTIDKEKVLNQFLDKLEKILIVPLCNFPLDEEAMLGSDGHTYGRKFLCVHRFKSESPFNQRSPLRPDDPTPLTAIPHEIARAMVCWLKRYRPHFSSELVEREYRQIPQDKMPLFPEKPAKANPLQEKLQRIVLEELARKQEHEQRERELSQQRGQLEALIDQVVFKRLTILQEQTAQKDAAMNGRLNHVEGQVQIAVAVFKEKYDQIESNLNNLDHEIAGLKDQLKRVGEEIISAHTDNLRLQTGIKQTEKVIRDREKGALKEFFTGVAVMGACVLGAWAASVIIKSMGAATASATVTTKANTVTGNLIVPIKT